MDEVMGFGPFTYGRSVHLQRWPLLQRFGRCLDKHSAALGHQMGHQTPQTVAAMQDQLASKAMGQKMIKPVIQRELWIKRTILCSETLDFDLKYRLAGGLNSLMENLLNRRDRSLPPTPGHVPGEDLVGGLNLTVLIQQCSKDSAAAPSFMPGRDPDHTQPCGAAG